MQAIENTPEPVVGPLELSVMQVLWETGESSVRDVTARLTRELAYTTIMTTLDRLYKKGLVARRKLERAFLYSPQLTRAAWQQRRAGEYVAGLAVLGTPSHGLSFLVAAVGRYDDKLLDELERTIRQQRRELKKRG